jgi:predicted lipid-binding transport protein (Tim44 family)
MNTSTKQSTPPSTEDQPSLLDLLTKQLSTPNAKPVPLPLVSHGIGGELIAILSKGLYTNPLAPSRSSVRT